MQQCYQPLYILGATSKNAEFAVEENNASKLLRHIDDDIKNSKTSGDRMRLVSLKKRAEYITNRSGMQKFLVANAYGTAEIAFARLGVVGTVGKTSRLAATLGNVSRKKFTNKYAKRLIDKFKTKKPGNGIPVPKNTTIASAITYSNFKNAFPAIGSRLTRFGQSAVGKATKPLRTFSSEALKEGVEESLTQISQNLIDITLDQQHKSVFEGVSEAFLLGATLGGVLGSASLGVRAHIVKPMVIDKYGGAITKLSKDLLEVEKKLHGDFDQLTVEERERLMRKGLGIRNKMNGFYDLLEANAVQMAPKELLYAHELEGKIRGYDNEIEKIKETGKKDIETLQSIQDLEYKKAKVRAQQTELITRSLTFGDTSILNNLSTADNESIAYIKDKLTSAISYLRLQNKHLAQINEDNPSEDIDALIADNNLAIQENQKHVDIIKEAEIARDEKEAAALKEEKEKDARRADKAEDKAKRKQSKGQKATTKDTSKDEAATVIEGIQSDKPQPKKQTKEETEPETKKEPKKETKPKAKEEEETKTDKKKTPKKKEPKAKLTEEEKSERKADRKRKQKELDIEHSEAEVAKQEKDLDDRLSKLDTDFKAQQELKKSRESARIKRFREELEGKKGDLEAANKTLDNLDKLINNPENSKYAKVVADDLSEDISDIVDHIVASTDSQSGSDALENLKEAINKSNELTKKEKKAKIDAIGDSSPIDIRIKHVNAELKQNILGNESYSLRHVDGLFLELDMLEGLKDGFKTQTDKFEGVPFGKEIKYDVKEALTEKELAELEQRKADAKVRQDKAIKEVGDAIKGFLRETSENEAKLTGQLKGAGKYIKYFTYDDIVNIGANELDGLTDKEVTVDFATKRTFEFLLGRAGMEKLKEKGKYDAFLTDPSLSVAPNRRKIAAAQGFTDEELDKLDLDNRIVSLGILLLQPYISIGGLLKVTHGGKGLGNPFLRVKNKNEFKQTDLYKNLLDLKEEGVVDFPEKKWLNGEAFRLEILDEIRFNAIVGYKGFKQEISRNVGPLAQIGTWKPYIDEETKRQPDTHEVSKKQFHATKKPAVIRVKTTPVKNAKGKVVGKHNKIDDWVAGLYSTNAKYKTGIADNRKPQPASKPIKFDDYKKNGLRHIAHSSKKQNERLKDADETKAEFDIVNTQIFTTEKGKNNFFEYLFETGFFDNPLEVEDVRRSKHNAIVKVLNIAKQWENDNFTIPHFKDTRGRWGSYVKGFNHYQHKIAKVLHNHGFEVDLQMEGFSKLMASIPDYLGTGYEITMADGKTQLSGAMTEKDRSRQGVALWTDVANVIEHPTLEKSKEILKHADKYGEITDFIAVAYEANNVLKWVKHPKLGNGDPSKYQTSHGDWIDASSSGAQNNALATQDSWTAEKVNLNGNLYTKEDLYIYIARQGIDNLEIERLKIETHKDDLNKLTDLAEKGVDFEERFKQAMYTPNDVELREEGMQTQMEVLNEFKKTIGTEKFNEFARNYFGKSSRLDMARKLAKDPVMIKYYSAGAFTMAVQLVQSMKTKKEFKDISLPLAFWFTMEISKVADKYAPGPAVARKIQTFLTVKFHEWEQSQKLAGVEDYLKPIELTAFHNDFPFEQNYFRIDHKSHDVILEELGLTEDDLAKGSQLKGKNPENYNLDFGSNFQPSLRTNKLVRDAAKSETSFPANYVHGPGDAQQIAWYNLAAEMQKYNRLSVHDNVIGHLPYQDHIRRTIMQGMDYQYSGKMHVDDAITVMINQMHEIVADKDQRESMIAAGVTEYKRLRRKYMKNPITGEPIPLFDFSSMENALYGYGTHGTQTFSTYHKDTPLETKVFIDKILPTFKDADKQVIGYVADQLEKEQNKLCKI